MLRFSFTKHMISAGLIVFGWFALTAGEEMNPALAAQPEEVTIIQTTEVQEEEQAAPPQITLEEVEQARSITAGRIYWLLGLWAFIMLSIVVVLIQLRDDDRLYREGYYSKDL